MNTEQIYQYDMGQNAQREKVVDGHLSAILTEFMRLTEENVRLRKQLQERGRDEEIQKLEEELRNVRDKSLRIMTDAEINELSQFKKTHGDTCDTRCFQYAIEATCIGSVFRVKCPTCGTERDITDYFSW